MASNISILKEELALAVANAAAKRIICNAAEDVEKQARSRLHQAEADERERNVHRVRVSDRRSQFRKGIVNVFVSEGMYAVDLAFSPDPDPKKNDKRTNKEKTVDGYNVHETTYSVDRDKCCAAIAPNTILYMDSRIDKSVWEGLVTSQSKTEKLGVGEAFIWQHRNKITEGVAEHKRRLADPNFYQLQRSWKVNWKRISAITPEWKKYLDSSNPFRNTCFDLTSRPPPCV